MVLLVSGAEGGEVLWVDFFNGERSDPWGPGIPNSIQHCGGHIGKGGASGIMWATGIASWVEMVSGRANYSVLCEKRSHRGQ